MRNSVALAFLLAVAPLPAMAQRGPSSSGARDTVAAMIYVNLAQVSHLKAQGLADLAATAPPLCSGWSAGNPIRPDFRINLVIVWL